MKSILLFAALFASAMLAASAPPAATNPSATAGVDATFIDPNSQEVAEIRTLGERAVNRIGVSLVNEVNATIKKEGVEKAVETCHLKALPMTGAVIADMPRITAVKRTSLKLRNPANAPDAADQLALKRVESALARDEEPPKVLIQRINLPGGTREWRVYRPLGLRPECVACHGERDSQSPGLRASLEKLYPNDQAVGYAAGQWRGLIRVTVAEAAKKN